jgi:hypothetical protein
MPLLIEDIATDTQILGKKLTPSLGVDIEPARLGSTELELAR